MSEVPLYGWAELEQTSEALPHVVVGLGRRRGLSHIPGSGLRIARCNQYRMDKTVEHKYLFTAKLANMTPPTHHHEHMS